ncbi:MAG TPA: class III lanthionine synthetase LanKC [Ktedonobacteraceae bacterium]|nr:class III lanthionine synthetase LanKC [Ktedonobacteraceae bacterium]
MASNGQYYHQFFSLFHDQWYEGLARYQPGDELLAIVYALLPAHWTISRGGSWFTASSPTRPLPSQGWKIHISATRQNCEEILQRVARICIQEEITFKFFLDCFMVGLSTSKLMSRGASGKYITIYPPDDDSFHALLRLLSEALQGFTGPYILSDRRYQDSSVIYYRYGGISGLSKLSYLGVREYILTSPTGETVPDQRTPYWNPPAWVVDPFEQDDDEPDDDESPMTLKSGRYEVESVLKSSVAGGVYCATDHLTGQQVVIKEARRAVGADKQGRDAVDYLQREYRLLQKLQHTGVTAQPIDLFWEWEHLFLVEEYIAGIDLGDLTIASLPFGKVQQTAHDIAAYVEKLRAIWLHLAQGLVLLHELDVVHGDVTIRNIIVSDEETGKIYFVDLEGAWEEGVDAPLSMATPGFAHTPGEENSKKDDIYGLGAIMLATLFPLNSFFEVEPTARQRIVQRFCTILGIGQEGQQLIEACLNNDPMLRPELPDIINTIKHFSVEPATISTCSPITQEELLNTVKGVTEYIRASADLSRHDRLFPADPRVFDTNPLSVAYGASGIAYALHHLDVKIPATIRAWMLKQTINQEHYPPGLYIGSAGIAWALWDIGMQEAGVRVLRSARNHPLLWDAADIFYGASGYGMACLRLYLGTRDQEWLDQAIQIGNGLLQRKEVDAERGYYWPDREGRSRLSYAHGASGIALYLLYLHRVTGDHQFLEAGRQGLAFDLSYLHPMEEGYLSTPRGTTEQLEKVISHYWFNGSAGVLTTLLRYWQWTKDQTYLHIFELLIKDVCRQLTIFPSLFLGLSGLGNVLLDAYDVLQDEHYLQQAHRTVPGILMYKLVRPQGIAFPGEQLLRISTDFGTGSAGVALFLHRLAHAEQHPGNFNFLLDQFLA